MVDIGDSSRARWSRIASALEMLGLTEPGVIHERFVFDYRAILADQRREHSLLLSTLFAVAVSVSAVVLLVRSLVPGYT